MSTCNLPRKTAPKAAAQKMKPAQTIRAFTLLELLAVIAIIAILAALLFPVLAKGKSVAKRAVCTSQLHQIGVSFQSFAHDHNSHFPMQISTNLGGTAEWVQSAARIRGYSFLAYRHFQVLESELRTPKPLVCPADDLSPAASFSSLDNSHLSYQPFQPSDPRNKQKWAASCRTSAQRRRRAGPKK